MNISFFLKFLLEENTGLRSKENDYMLELKGFLETSKLCDYICKTLPEERLNSLKIIQNSKSFEVSINNESMSIKITGYPDKQIKFTTSCEDFCYIEFEICIKNILQEHLNELFIFSIDTSQMTNEEIKKDLKSRFMNVIFERNLDQFIFKIGTKSNFDVDYLGKKNSDCFYYIYQHKEEYYCVYYNNKTMEEYEENHFINYMVKRTQDLEMIDEFIRLYCNKSSDTKGYVNLCEISVLSEVIKKEHGLSFLKKSFLSEEYNDFLKTYNFMKENEELYEIIKEYCNGLNTQEELVSHSFLFDKNHSFSISACDIGFEDDDNLNEKRLIIKNHKKKILKKLFDFMLTNYNHILEEYKDDLLKIILKSSIVQINNYIHELKGKIQSIITFYNALRENMDDEIKNKLQDHFNSLKYNYLITNEEKEIVMNFDITN